MGGTVRGGLVTAGPVGCAVVGGDVAAGGGTAVIPGGAVGIGDVGAFVVVGPAATVVAVGALTVVVVAPTGRGGGSSLPLTLAPESLVNDVLRHLPGSVGAGPISSATLDASTSRPSLVR